MIDSITESEIDQQLDQLEQKTSSEIAVVTIKSLGDMPVEEYANKLFKEWGVGQKGQDNGVLVLVSPSDRKMRIEVGYGLEGVLPDGLAGQIIRDQFTPKFKSNDYSGGIKDGVDRLVQIVEKHEVLTPEQLARFNQGNNKGITLNFYWVTIPFFALFIAIGFGMLGAGIRTKTMFPVLFGSFFGGMPLVMSIFFLGYLSFVTEFPLAIFAVVFGYRQGAKESIREVFRNAKTSPGTGWTMGNTESSGGSSDSSSSSSSSDFGGGSSGGGGASGSW